MNDESLSADNDVARSLARRCKQSDGSCRRLNHYVSYTQPHPSILMRPPQQQQPARPSVSSPVTPSLAAAAAAAASTPARPPAAGNEIIALMHVAYAVGPVNHSTPVLAAAWFSSVRTAGPHAQASLLKTRGSRILKRNFPVLLDVFRHSCPSLTAVHDYEAMPKQKYKSTVCISYLFFIFCSITASKKYTPRC